jgi:hypothetical protein
MRSSYEGNGRLSIALAMSSVLVYPRQDGVEIRPKDFGTRMRANDLSIALEGPASWQAADADDPAEGH